jgi:hypothetical protein
MKRFLLYGVLSRALERIQVACAGRAGNALGTDETHAAFPQAIAGTPVAR